MAGWLKYLILDFVLGVTLALLRQFVCVLSYIKGRSMQDSLFDGEVVFALRRSIHGGIRRFDVVLCRYPGKKGLFIKRVAGLPGETIRIEEDILYINGEAVEEDFPRRKCLRPMMERQLGADEYFVLGDNRPASRDSRSVGPIPLKNIVAVVKCVVFPFKRIRKIR